MFAPQHLALPPTLRHLHELLDYTQQTTRVGIAKRDGALQQHAVIGIVQGRDDT